SFIFCSALYLIAAVLVFAFVREGAPTLDGESTGEPPPVGRATHGGLLESLRVVTKERQVVLMLLFLFVLWLSTTFGRPVRPISIHDFAGTGGAAAERVHLEFLGWKGDLREEAATGIVFSVIGLTSTISAFALAPLGERLGYKNIVTSAAV